MDPAALRKHQSLILAAILIFMGIALILRTIPAFFIQDPGFLYIFDTDSWYTMRQVEVMVNNFPQYNWFDPMTAYPTGKIIDWGPLYPFFAATLCLITGATSRGAIIFTAGWVAPLMAMMMVPVMFQLGKLAGDWKTGIIAAGLISVVSVQYFSLSSYGWVDHHIGEVLFSTLFLFGYVATVSYARSHPVDLKVMKSVLLPAGFSAITGILLFLAILISTTVLVTLAVIVIYTLVQMILDFSQDRDAADLTVVNGALLAVTIILLFVFGFKSEGLSITRYTIGIPYLLAAIIAGTLVLFILSYFLRGKRIAYMVSLVVLTGGIGFVSQVFQPFNALSQQATSLFFGSQEYSVSVIETLPWTLSGAWANFNFALVLMAGGLLILGMYAVKKKESRHIFLLVWSMMMMLLTIRFQRFAYYFTVNVVLLAAICIAEPLTWRDNLIARRWSVVSAWFSQPGLSPVVTGYAVSKKDTAASKPDKKKPIRRPGRKTSLSNKAVKDGAILAIVVLIIGLVAVSVPQEIGYGLSTPANEIPGDWIGALEWMKSDTPETGVDYYKSYDAQQFTYPNSSYGIMAIWDAGHWITFFAHRIPITNPFQDHLAGPEGTAAFFLNTNESKASDIIGNFGGRYVITDAKMAVDTFTNLVPWQSNSVDISPYIKYFLIPDSNNVNNLKIIHKFDNNYFQTMVVRLHNFDGSMTLPGEVEYVRYEIRQPTKGETSPLSGYVRIIRNDRLINASQLDTSTPIIQEGPVLLPTQYANIFSGLPNTPVQKVPALHHYRLVYESIDNASVTPFPESDPIALPGIKYVKVFEFVKGAQVRGEGIIELPVMTNTGRMFRYRQESENGTFTVPYPTTGGPYDVHATAGYHIVGTTRFITVTENDIAEGREVVG